jgi:hypothetical protein
MEAGLTARIGTMEEIGGVDRSGGTEAGTAENLQKESHRLGNDCIGGVFNLLQGGVALAWTTPYFPSSFRKQ